MACAFCESALSNCMGTLLVDWVVKPVGHQLNYIRRFHDNAEKLKEKKEELKMARARLQHEIEDAKRRHQGIEDDVTTLLSKADKILSDMETLENEMQQNKRCFNLCPNWSWQYQLSKKATKNTPVSCELLKEIRQFCQPGRVGYRSTSTITTIEFLSSKDFMVSKSSNIALDHIIQALKDDRVSMIGLWGMAGVGKTSLVCEVGTYAKKKNLFDKVVITTVSQKPNFDKIQDEIAKDLDFYMKNEQGRISRQEFWSKLKEVMKVKRILIILDDVWAKIDLKEGIGIPIGEDHKGCKILLTTRRQQVCDAMECQRRIQLGFLDDQEAWDLFATKAGLIDSSDDAIKNVATKIVQKCKGLPIAIATLANALKGKNHHRWKAAHRRLKNCRLGDIEDIDQQNAYVCLEVSFDYLKDTEIKMCFLLCSLFPEDYKIYVEDLVRYAWGLELYKGVDSIEAVRGEVLAAMDILKDSCLLLNCGEWHVRMHDLVRDVALWIASNRKEFSFMIKSDVVDMWPKKESFESYEAVSFNTSRIVELPKGLVCPNLKILLLGGDRKMTTSSEFFEGMTALKVCALNSRLISPDAFQFQTNLTTLHLESCELSDISVLGKLKKLEVLSFSGSDIKELPEEIGDLDNLKLLDLSYCVQLQRIPSQLIPRLSKLEELYLHGCQLLKWATENTVRQERFASLSELNSLSNLIVLSLEVSSEDIPRDFVFCKLQRFYVCVGFDFDFFDIFGISDISQKKMDLEICPLSRSLKIQGSVMESRKLLIEDIESLKIEGSAMEACKQLFGDIESLNLNNVVGCQNLAPSLQSGQVVFSKLTSLVLVSCKHMKCLIDITKQQELTNAFSNLLELSLTNMRGLEELCSGHQQGPSHHVSLQSLKVVRIDNCNKLRYLFPTSVAKSLGQLETLNISDCLELEEIIPKTEVTNINLQSLREVHVSGCRKLTSLSSLSHGQSLENLTTLKIINCSRLEYTFPISMAEGLPQLNKVTVQRLAEFKGRDGNDIVLMLPSLQALEIRECPQFIISTKILIAESRSIQQGPSYHVSLQSLKVVTIDNCDKLRYLFPTSVAESLGQLEMLDISECLELEEIIPKTEVSNINLQNLRKVCVSGCNNLTSLSSLSHGQILEKLSTLRIWDCSRLEYTFPISMAEGLPQLNEVRLGRLPELKGRDGNDIVLTLPSLQKLYVDDCPQLTPFIISAKIQVLQFKDMGEKKKSCNMIVPKLGQKLPNMEYLTIINFEELFDGGYNFSSLKELILDDLPELRVAWKDPIQVVNFQNLTKLHVFSCGRLRYILSPTIGRNLPQLSSLRIYECEELEQIIEKDGQASSQGHHLQPICLPNLTEIEIHKCENLKSLFPISVAHGLSKLQKLIVENVSKLEQVFEKSGDEANGSEEKEKVIQLPQLGTLHLSELPNLVRFSPVGYRFVFPSLYDLTVRGCPNITTSFSVDSEQSGHAKTEAILSIDENIVEESTRAQQKTWPIGSDISWCSYIKVAHFFRVRR